MRSNGNRAIISFDVCPAAWMLVLAEKKEQNKIENEKILSTRSEDQYTQAESRAFLFLADT